MREAEQSLGKLRPLSKLKPLKGLGAPYEGVTKIFSTYWRLYGGWAALLGSPYLHISALGLLLTVGTWTEKEWWSQVIAILPNLVGFSIGAFAIFLGVGGEGFQGIIAGRSPISGRNSPFLRASASFCHFIIVQVLAILVALVLASCYRQPVPFAHAWAVELNEVLRPVFWMLGYWLFLYAITLTFGTVMVIFRTATWFDTYKTGTRKAKRRFRISIRPRSAREAATREV